MSSWLPAYDASGRIGSVNLDRVSFLEVAGADPSWRVTAHIGTTDGGTTLRSAVDLARDLPSRDEAAALLDELISETPRRPAQKRGA